MSSTAQAAAPRSLGREDILALGRSARPWDFLPIAQQALRIAPHDGPIRLLAAAHFARLGLKTAAAEHLALAPAELRNLPELQGLAAVIDHQEDDILTVDQRVSTGRQNVGTISNPPPALATSLPAWERSAAGWIVCRANDGNVIRRRNEDAPGEWALLADHLGGARRAAESLPPTHAEAPLYLEGADPPWVLLELLRRRPARADGYRPPTCLVQADPLELLDGLSLVDLRPAMTAGHLIVFVGPDAGPALAEHLASRRDYHIAGTPVALQHTRRRVSPPLHAIVDSARSSQDRLTAELAAQVSDIYEGRTPAWWRRRYETAEAASPLRVLIPTCRYSTFIKHASAGLAAAFERRGCSARVLIEPDDSTRLAVPSFLRAVADFRPDLVIFINYPRAMFPDCFPANVPYVCWVQDAMPHLFDARLGRAQGPLDFLAGYAFEELFEHHQYPRDRAIALHLPADETRFHSGPLSPTQRQRLECEIAYVSHQSETLDAQHTRLRAMFAEKLGVRRSIDALRPIIEREALKPLSDLHHELIHDRVREQLRDELKAEPDPRLVDTVYKSYCQPLADRLLRHQTLQWTAQVAARRGWRFRLFGRGWEKHPTLGGYASGELAHGDDLRAAYQAATVQLHMTGQSLVHQRLFECALSGGVPLCRFHAHERWLLVAHYLGLAQSQGALALGSITTTTFPRGADAVRDDAAPAMAELRAIMTSLGVQDDVLPAAPDHPGATLYDYSVLPRNNRSPVAADRWSAYFTLARRAELFFHSPQSLETRAAAIIESPTLRHQLSDDLRRATADQHTYAALSRRLLTFVTECLPGATP